MVTGNSLTAFPRPREDRNGIRNANRHGRLDRHATSSARGLAPGPVRWSTVALALAVIALVAPRPAIAAPAAPTALTAPTCAKAPGAGLTLTDVAAHGGRLVAVGSNGLIATSGDGVDWTVRRSGVQHDLRGVAWAGDNWVAVGDAGTIVRSLDRGGTQWAPVSGIPVSSLRAVAAKPGLVVAGGSNGLILISTDGGASWRTAASGTTSTLWGATSHDGTLYMVGDHSTIVASADGLSWQRVAAAPRPTGSSIAPRPFLWQMAIGGGHRVAVGDFGAILQSGARGKLAGVRSPVDEILRGATYGRRGFVLVGSGGMIVSGSGSRGGWRTQTSPTPVDLRGVAWNGRRFVAVGDEGTVVVSSDGRSWRVVTSAMPCAFLGVASGAGRLIAVGGNGTLLATTDAKRWRRISVPTTADLYSIAHGPEGFVAVGTGGVVMWSRDGRRWSLDRSVTSLNLHTVAWTGRGYTAGGDRGKLLSSTDGKRWAAVKRYPGYHAVRAIAANGGAIVLAGSGTVASNASGGRWLLEPIGFQHFWTGVAYGAGVFVIVGHNGTELLSGDAGLTWVPVTTGAAVNLDAVAWTGTEFVAAGQGTAVASPDGTNWQPIPVKSRYSVRALALFDGHLIGVGDQRTIVQVR